MSGITQIATGAQPAMSQKKSADANDAQHEIPKKTKSAFAPMINEEVSVWTHVWGVLSTLVDDPASYSAACDAEQNGITLRAAMVCDFRTNPDKFRELVGDEPEALYKAVLNENNTMAANLLGISPKFDAFSLKKAGVDAWGTDEQMFLQYAKTYKALKGVDPEMAKTYNEAVYAEYKKLTNGRSLDEDRKSELNGRYEKKYDKIFNSEQ